jgi:hypothetical protein
MHKYYRHILILSIMLLTIASMAFAQGLGVGIGLDDIRRGGVGVSAPATFLILNGGGKIALNGGGVLQCNFC